MKWYSPKERLPEPEDVVLIKLNYAEPFICVARYLDHLITWDGDFKDVFIMIIHPRFPKTWMFDERYKKISRIPKSKVEKWTSITGV